MCNTQQHTGDNNTHTQFFGVRPTRPAFVKEKKKVHKKSLTVATYYVGKVQPYSPELLEESRSKLEAMDSADKERIALESSKNKVESYLYKIKNDLIDKAESLEKVSTEEQREEVKKLADAAEEWLYEDGYAADLATMEDKYAELSIPYEKILLRLSELKARPAAMTKLSERLTEIESIVASWEKSMPQITEEEKTGVLDLVEGARKWMEEKEAEQAAKAAHEEPAFLSEIVPSQSKPIERMVVKLSKKPKPKPEKKENATSAENATEPDAEATADSEANETEANETESVKEEGESPPTEEDPEL